MSQVRIFCNEVVVKYKANVPDQRIRFSMGPTQAHKLCVVDDGIRLAIYFLGAAGDIVKMIGVPFTEFREYDCNEVQDKHPVMPSAQQAQNVKVPA